MESPESSEAGDGEDKSEYAWPIWNLSNVPGYLLSWTIHKTNAINSKYIEILTAYKYISKRKLFSSYFEKYDMDEIHGWNQMLFDSLYNQKLVDS